MSLASAPTAARMRITSINGDGAHAGRMMEMGIIEGAEVSVVRRAPLGDPLQIRLGDYELSLRSLQAELVNVEPI